MLNEQLQGLQGVHFEGLKPPTWRPITRLCSNIAVHSVLGAILNAHNKNLS